MNGICLYVGVIVGIIGMLLITVLNRGDIARIRASGVVWLFIELMILVIKLLAHR